MMTKYMFVLCISLLNLFESSSWAIKKSDLLKIAGDAGVRPKSSDRSATRSDVEPDHDDLLAGPEGEVCAASAGRRSSEDVSAQARDLLFKVNGMFPEYMFSDPDS